MKIGAKKNEFRSSLSDIKFSSLPTSDVILVHEDGELPSAKANGFFE